MFGLQHIFDNLLEYMYAYVYAENNKENKFKKPDAYKNVNANSLQKF